MGQYSLITPQHMCPAHLIRLQLIGGSEGILSDAFFQKDEMVDVKGTPQKLSLCSSEDEVKFQNLPRKV